MRFGLIAAFAVLALATPASGRDVYVNNTTGDDRYDGLEPRPLTRGIGPVHSIGRALRTAGPGDRVVIANTGVPYYESITLQAGKHSGIPGFPFELVGNGATLDGSAPLNSFVWQPYQGDVMRFRPARLTFQQLFLDHAPAVRAPLGENPRLVPDLQPLEWRLCDNWVYFRVEAGRLPHQYDLRYARYTVGVTLYEVHDVIIRDLITQGFVLDGINAHDGVRRTTLLGVTSRGNGRSGISIGGASQVDLEACLVGDNGQAQVRTEGQCRVRIVNCDLIDDAAPALEKKGGRVEVVQEAVAEPAAF